ncbi:hypothetical protein RND81_01G066600 [Saponaria officinalis]|uniref:Protein kinase domain-containing protein n=1 Tax=Saponaria officinalis TaxID=3572 RepID=A0AAW1NC34_SAPOF
MAFAHGVLKAILTLVSSIFVIILPCQKIYSLSDGDVLLQFKNSLSNANALSNWGPNTMPCQNKSTQWNGIICYEGIITGIHLKSMGLFGNVDVEVLTNLPGLRSISLEDNMFVGKMPEFNRLGALKALYLSNNQFIGPIAPDYFSKMGSLKKLWLSNNRFSGEIPPSLVNLRHLIELHLENNQFSGLIPAFMSPPLVSLDLSNNQLVGEIPTSLSNFKAPSFAGNPYLCGQIIGNDCNQVTIMNKGSNTQPIDNSNNKSNEKDKSKTKGVAIGVIISVVILSFVIVIVVCGTKKKRNCQNDIPTAYTKPTKAPENVKLASKANKINEGVVEVVEVAPTLSRKNSSQSSKRSNSSRRGSNKGGGGGVGDLIMVNAEKVSFGLGDLMKASAEVLGNGGMGSAYKAVMTNGMSVAVKRMRELNRLENEAFGEEVRKLASLRHKNILSPLAYHYRKEEKLIVYEYVAKGSLHFLLHGDRGISHAELNWPRRLKIIKGTIEGLSYLHTQLASYDLPHGNLKSSNILINLQNEPLISDYGFNAMTNPNVASNTLFAYKSPEVIQGQSISPKCDIYCLGVVILEILTCKFPSQYLNTTKGGTDVVQWVASAIAEGREGGLIDSDIVSRSPNCKENMVELLHVGAACTVANPENRPSLKEVLERVNRVYVHDVKDDQTIQVLSSPRDDAV